MSKATTTATIKIAVKGKTELTAGEGDGPVDALNVALRAVAQPGDIIAVESPTYFGLLQVLESLGLRALEIPTSPQTGILRDTREIDAIGHRTVHGTRRRH